MPVRGVVARNLRMPMNQMEGVQQEIPRVISLMPAQTAADYENIVARLKSAPALIDATIAMMREGLAQKMTPPQVVLLDLPKQVEGQIVAEPLASPLLAAFKAWPPAVPSQERG